MKCASIEHAFGAWPSHHMAKRRKPPEDAADKREMKLASANFVKSRDQLCDRIALDMLKNYGFE